MTKKLVLLLTLLISSACFGQMQVQDTPDCQIGLDSNGVNTDSVVIDNRFIGCTSWTLYYSSTGFSAESLEFQSAPDSSGAPGAFVTWANIDSGSSLPLTSTTGGQVMGFRFQPWAKIHINSTTGTGRIIAKLIGYKPFKGATDPTNGSQLVTIASGSVSVTGSVTPGTASANTLGGIPMICDSTASGSVTAGQAQMVKCDTGGILKLGLNNGNNDAVSTNENAIMSGNATAAPLQVAPKFFNGATTSRPYVASLANYATASTTTARNSAGVQLFEKGSRWVVNSAPAAGSQATASIAAEASVRHVLDTLCFSSGSAVAPVLTSLQVNVRDGATGAGTILMSFEVEIPAATGQDTPPICINGLNLVGTTNTAMTVEWNAGLANLKQTASAIGFNVI